MNTRMSALRNELNLTMNQFGEKLGVTRSAISRLESGERSITDQMIKSICREFNVNEEWLRTGNGNMFDDTSREEMAARIVGKALNTNDEFILNTFIALGQLSETEWNVVKKFVDAIKSGNKDFKYNDPDN